MKYINKIHSEHVCIILVTQQYEHQTNQHTEECLYVDLYKVRTNITMRPTTSHIIKQLSSECTDPMVAENIMRGTVIQGIRKTEAILRKDLNRQDILMRLLRQ